MQTTESALKEWRSGSIAAERLCAQILLIEGFSGVDPQSPLGGPDGGKDIRCRAMDGSNWIGAVYFPPTEQAFSEIKGKFLRDAAKVSPEAGIVFMTNQFLTVGERERILDAASGRRIEFYHGERLRALLDDPRGYGLRLEYLRIAMTEAEQIAFFKSWGNRVENAIEYQSGVFDALSSRFDGYLSNRLRSLSDMREMAGLFAGGLVVVGPRLAELYKEAATLRGPVNTIAKSARPVLARHIEYLQGDQSLGAAEKDSFCESCKSLSDLLEQLVDAVGRKQGLVDDLIEQFFASLDPQAGCAISGGDSSLRSLLEKRLMAAREPYVRLNTLLKAMELVMNMELPSDSSDRPGDQPEL